MNYLYSLKMAPIALHVLYPLLPDGKLHMDQEIVKSEYGDLPGREHALDCNTAWRSLAKNVMFFLDRGVSSGMYRALRECLKEEMNCFFTFLDDNENIPEILERLGEETLCIFQLEDKKSGRINFLKL